MYFFYIEKFPSDAHRLRNVGGRLKYDYKTSTQTGIKTCERLMLRICFQLGKNIKVLCIKLLISLEPDFDHYPTFHILRSEGREDLHCYKVLAPLLCNLSILQQLIVYCFGTFISGELWLHHPTFSPCM